MIPGQFKLRFDAVGLFYELDFRPDQPVQGERCPNGFVVKPETAQAVVKFIGGKNRRKLEIAEKGWPVHFSGEISEALYALHANR